MSISGSLISDRYSEFGLAPFVAVAITGVVVSLAFTVRAWRRRAQVPLLLGSGMLAALLYSLLYLPRSLAGLLGLSAVPGDLSRRGEIEIMGSLAVLSAVLGAAAVGYYWNRAWSRHLAVASWPLRWVCFAIQSRWDPTWSWGELLREGAEILPFMAVSLWYFYFKESVVAYYVRLGRAA